MIRAKMYMENADIDLHDLDADILFYHRVHDLPLPVQHFDDVQLPLEPSEDAERTLDLDKAMRAVLMAANRNNVLRSSQALVALGFPGVTALHLVSEFILEKERRGIE